MRERDRERENGRESQGERSMSDTVINLISRKKYVPP